MPAAADMTAAASYGSSDNSYASPSASWDSSYATSVASYAAASVATAAYSPSVTYGSGSSNWGSDGYNSCVQREFQRFLFMVTIIHVVCQNALLASVLPQLCIHPRRRLPRAAATLVPWVQALPTPLLLLLRRVFSASFPSQ